MDAVNNGISSFDSFRIGVAEVTTPIVNMADRIHKIVEKIWSYISKPVSIAKNALKGIKASFSKGAVSELLTKVKTAIAVIGLLSMVNMLLTVGSFPEGVKKDAEAIRLGAGEEAIRGVLSRMLAVGSFLGDMSTFVTSLVALNTIPAIAFFAAVGLPLALVSLSMGIATGIYDTVHQSVQLYKMHKETKNPKNLMKYLEEKLEVKDEEYIDSLKKKYGVKVFSSLKEILNGNAKLSALRENENVNRASRKLLKQLSKSVNGKEKLQALLKKDREDMVSKKKLILTRRTDKKVVEYMKKLKLGIEQEPDNKELVENGIADMKKLMRRKITLGVIGIASRTAMLVTLVASLVFPFMTPIAVPAVGGATALLGLGTHIYKNNFMDKGLRNEFKHIELPKAA